MGLLNRKTAKALDTAASTAHQVGRAVAGQTGERVAGAVVNTALGGIRDRLNVGCTCGTDTCPDRH